MTEFTTEFTEKVEKMLSEGKLEVAVNNKNYILELHENGEIGILGLGSRWQDNGLLKDNVDSKLADFIQNLEEFVDYKQNGISFPEVWELVAEAKEIGDEKLRFAKEFLNINKEVIEVAEKLDNLSLEGEINLSDDEIDNIDFETAKTLIDELERNNDYEMSGIG